MSETVSVVPFDQMSLRARLRHDKELWEAQQQLRDTGVSVYTDGPYNFSDFLGFRGFELFQRWQHSGGLYVINAAVIDSSDNAIGAANSRPTGWAESKQGDMLELSYWHRSDTQMQPVDLGVAIMKGLIEQSLRSPAAPGAFVVNTDFYDSDGAEVCERVGFDNSFDRFPGVQRRFTMLAPQATRA